MFDLTGRVALITGGGSGIGLAIAQAFAQSGARVLVGSRTVEKIEGAVKEINNLVKAPADEAAAAGVALDVTSEGSAQRAARKAVETFGRLDILVNCAGIILRKPTFELRAEDFNNIYNTHATGSLRCAQACGHLFREQHQGCIINIASISSFVDLVEVAAYAAAKNAVLGLTRSLANEWAKFGIRTNAIAPGFVPTDFNRKMIENTDRGRRILEHTPAARFGTADEIAGGAVYLASPAASFVNGHCLVIDGGYLASGIGDSCAPWATPEK
jgi:NAD(P)-dependent dehydrogenase (short-subunit alcohol dehydrogenase family)